MTREVTISKSELTKIPFIDSENIKGRVLTTLTFFEKGEWQIWLALPTGLRCIKGEPTEANYFARTRQKDTDVYMDFLNFMAQRACWADAMKFIDGIQNDIHNLGASLGKLELFYHSSKTNPNLDATRFVSTEIEYIFGVCRSLFDLLQEVVATLWHRIELNDKSIKKCQLPESFRRMVLKNEQLMTVNEIQTKFHVPTELASFYHRNGPFFKILRQYRDNAMHRGADFRFVFVTKKGFAISADIEPFASFGVWNEKHMLPNRLASLRPAIAHVITETFRACEDFTQTIQRIISFPPDIVPGFKLFLRGYHNRQLLEMKDVLKNCSWWEDEHNATRVQ